MLCHASNTPWRLQALGLGIPPRQPPSSREREWDEMLRASSNSFVNISSLLSSTQANILEPGLVPSHSSSELSAKFSTKLRASRLKYLPYMPNILHFPLTQAQQILNKRNMLATSLHLLSLSAHIYCSLFWRHKCFAKLKKTKGHHLCISG